MVKIRTHKERVKYAKDSYNYRQDGLKLSRLDLEAYVELYLIEDVALYHVDRMNALRNGQAVITRDNRLTSIAIDRHAKISRVFQEIANLCRYLVEFGEYRTVWMTIPERQIFKLSRNISNKSLKELAAVATKIMKRLYSDAVELARNDAEFNTAQEYIRAEDENARQYYQLPSIDEIDEIVNEVNAMFPDNNIDKINHGHNKPNLN